MNQTNNSIVSAIGDTMEKARGKGCDCPVCGQFVKVYRRTINKAMARQLSQAYRKFGVGQEFHISDVFPGGGGDFAKLRYWGLITEIENSDHNKKSSGKWYVTFSGAAFLKGTASVSKYVLIYNGKFLDFEGLAPITFKECLGKDFDYHELMSA